MTDYLRTILIYYNLLMNMKKVSKHHDYEFLEILNKIKLSNINIEKYLYGNLYNMIELYKFIKINNKDNKYVIDFGLKLIYDFLIKLDNINKSQLDNIITEFIEFIIKKVFKSDELFTNFNYAQLKQMFSENIPDHYNTNYTDPDDDYGEEDDDLFSYNDIDVEFGDTDD